MNKILIVLIVVLCAQLDAHAGILNKKFVLYLPNKTKATVLVSRFNEKVTHIWRDNKWVELPRNPQHFYQRLYQLQKDRRKRRR